MQNNEERRRKNPRTLNNKPKSNKFEKLKYKKTMKNC